VIDLDTGGNIILKKIKLLMMATIVFGLSACVTNTGSGPITLSSNVLRGYEEFKNLKGFKTPSFFAVSEDGQSYGYSFCPMGQCNDNGDMVALSGCVNRSKKKCKIFADDTWILWKDASGRRITLQEASKGLSSEVTVPPHSGMTDKAICSMALSSKEIDWDNKADYQLYVNEAKRREFSIQKCAEISGRSDVVETPTDNSTNSIEERLENLKSLLEKGLITKDEAAAKRKAILEGL
jgi:hypothetical protein